MELVDPHAGRCSRAARRRTFPKLRQPESIVTDKGEASPPGNGEGPAEKARKERAGGSRVGIRLGSVAGPVARLRSVGALIPLVALWIGMTLASPVFLTGINIRNLLVQASALGVLAIGTTLVILTEEIDLSIGAVEGMGAVIAGIVAARHGLDLPFAIAAALGVGALVGMANGILTTIIGVPSFIATLGMLGVVSGLSLELTNGQSIYGFSSAYQRIGQGRVVGIPASVIFPAVLLVVLQFVLTQTRLGTYFYAVGGNRTAAEFVGISARRIKILAMVISGTCAAFAGVIVSSRLGAANPTFGTFDLLDAIAAVVIGGAALTGGVGSVVGTAVGVMLIVTIRNGLTLLNVSPFWQTTTVGLVIITAAILDRLARKGEQA
jgi:ribose/xylose/arabinose/galactoside ABC-type transport system permease subunit